MSLPQILYLQIKLSKIACMLMPENASAMGCRSLKQNCSVSTGCYSCINSCSSSYIHSSGYTVSISPIPPCLPYPIWVTSTLSTSECMSRCYGKSFPTCNAHWQCHCGRKARPPSMEVVHCLKYCYCQASLTCILIDLGLKAEWQ